MRLNEGKIMIVLLNYYIYVSSLLFFFQCAYVWLNFSWYCTATVLGYLLC